MARDVSARDGSHQYIQDVIQLYMAILTYCKSNELGEVDVDNMCLKRVFDGNLSKLINYAGNLVINHGENYLKELRQEVAHIIIHSFINRNIFPEHGEQELAVKFVEKDVWEAKIFDIKTLEEKNSKIKSPATLVFCFLVNKQDECVGDARILWCNEDKSITIEYDISCYQDIFYREDPTAVDQQFTQRTIDLEGNILMDYIEIEDANSGIFIPLSLSVIGLASAPVRIVRKHLLTKKDFDLQHLIDKNDDSWATDGGEVEEDLKTLFLEQPEMVKRTIQELLRENSSPDFQKQLQERCQAIFGVLLYPLMREIVQIDEVMKPIKTLETTILDIINKPLEVPERTSE